MRLRGKNKVQLETALIAAHIEQELEGFRKKHLTTVQSKELDQTIRQATFDMCHVLNSIRNSTGELNYYDFMDWLTYTVPEEWEAPERLSNSLPTMEIVREVKAKLRAQDAERRRKRAEERRSTPKLSKIPIVKETA